MVSSMFPPIRWPRERIVALQADRARVSNRPLRRGYLSQWPTLPRWSPYDSLSSSSSCSPPLIPAIQKYRKTSIADTRIPPSIVRDVDASAVFDQSIYKLRVEQEVTFGHQFIMPHNYDAVFAVIVIDFRQEFAHPPEPSQPLQLLHLQRGVRDAFMEVRLFGAAI